MQEAFLFFDPLFHFHYAHWNFIGVYVTRVEEGSQLIESKIGYSFRDCYIPMKLICFLFSFILSLLYLIGSVRKPPLNYHTESRTEDPKIDTDIMVILISFHSTRSYSHSDIADLKICVGPNKEEEDKLAKNCSSSQFPFQNFVTLFSRARQK